MTTPSPEPTSGCRVLVVGGGFYGCSIAIHLANRGNAVTLVDAGAHRLSRASYANQARVHQGYHYPRSLRTGLSCTVNFPRFVDEFASAVFADFTKVYAIARRNSRVTANQFASFCKTVGAPLREASRPIAGMFDHDLVEEVFEAREIAFNSRLLREILERRLADANVEIRGAETVRALRGRDDGTILGECAGSAPIVADRVFICLYSGINTLLRASGLPPIPMKHELAEIALVDPTDTFRDLGITVMDGPFFSTMPFPAESLHSFTHVRYTPHEAWRDEHDDRDPYRHVDSRRPDSQFSLMLRDAVRYLPGLSKVRYSHSLYEPKTVLLESEDNDGRPILHRPDHGLPGLTVILGGKIDNIYDILGRIDAAGG